MLRPYPRFWTLQTRPNLIDFSLLIGTCENVTYPVKIMEVKLPKAWIVWTIPSYWEIEFSRFIEKGEGVGLLRWGEMVG
jgi:hypothetical protein